MTHEPAWLSIQPVIPYSQQQRTKAGVIPLNQTLQVTSAELDIFWTFYDTTLANGTLTFTYRYPLSGQILKMRFHGGELPSAAAIGNNNYHLALPLEIMP